MRLPPACLLAGTSTADAISSRVQASAVRGPRRRLGFVAPGGEPLAGAQRFLDAADLHPTVGHHHAGAVLADADSEGRAHGRHLALRRLDHKGRRAGRCLDEDLAGRQLQPPCRGQLDGGLLVEKEGGAIGQYNAAALAAAARTSRPLPTAGRPESAASAGTSIFRGPIRPERTEAG